MAVTLGTIVSAVHGGSYPTNGTLTGVDCTGADSLVVIMYTNTTLQGPDFTIRFGSTDLYLVDSYQNTTAGYGEILIYQYPGTPSGIANVSYFQSTDTYNADRMVVAIPVYGTGSTFINPFENHTGFMTSNGAPETMMGISPPVAEAVVVSGVFHYYPNNPPADGNAMFGLTGWSTAFSETASQPIKALALKKTLPNNPQTHEAISRITHDAFNYVTGFAFILTPGTSGGEEPGPTTTPVGTSLDAGWSVSAPAGASLDAGWLISASTSAPATAAMAYAEDLATQPLGTAALEDVLSVTFAVQAGRQYFVFGTAAIYHLTSSTTSPSTLQVVDPAGTVLGRVSRTSFLADRTESMVASGVLTASETGIITVRAQAQAGLANTNRSQVRLAVIEVGTDDAVASKDDPVARTSNVLIDDLTVAVPASGDYLIIATAAYTAGNTSTFAGFQMNAGGQLIGAQTGMGDVTNGASRFPLGIAVKQSLTAGQTIALQHSRSQGTGSLTVVEQRILAIHLPSWSASASIYKSTNSAVATASGDDYVTLAGTETTVTGTGNRPMLCLWGGAGLSASTSGIRLALADGDSVIQPGVIPTAGYTTGRRTNVFQMALLPATAGPVTRKLMGSRESSSYTANWDEAGVTILEPAYDIAAIPREAAKPAGTLTASKTGQYAGLTGLWAWNSTTNLANPGTGDAAIQGAAAVETDAIGTALSTAGQASQYAATGLTGTQLGIGGSAVRTIFARIRPTDNDQGGFFSYGSATPGGSLTIRGTGGAGTGPYSVDFGWGEIVIPAGVIANNAVSTVVLAYTGTVLRVYVNGSLIGSATTALNTGTDAAFQISRYQFGSEPAENHFAWHGLVYELGTIAGSAWSDSEVAAYDSDPLAVFGEAPAATAVGADLGLVWAGRAAVGQQTSAVYAVRGTAGQQTTLPWAVRARLSTSLDAVWAGKSAVSGVFDAVWAGKVAVSGSFAAPWAGKAAVSGSLDLPWSGKAAVSGSLDAVWSGKSAAAASLTAGWDGKSTAVAPLDLPWAGKAAVSGMLTTGWNGKAAAGNSLTAGWDGRAATSAATDLIYGVRGVVSAGLDIGYDIEVKGSVAAGLDVGYAVRSTCSAAADLPWSGRATASGSLAAGWDGKSVTPADLTAGWDGRAATSADLDLHQDVRGVVSAGLGVPYDVEPRGTVSASLDADYAIRSPVSASLDAGAAIRGTAGAGTDLPAAIRGLVSAAADLPAAVRNAAAAGLDSRYGIRSTAGQQTTAVYAIRILAGQGSDIRWEIEAPVGRVGADLAAGYAIRQHAAGNLDADWAVRSRADSGVDHVWAIRSRAGRDLDAGWDGRTAAGLSLDAVHDVRQGQAAGIDAAWGIRSRTAQQTDLPWQVRQTAGESSDLPWILRQRAGSVLDLPSGVRSATSRQINFVWGLAALGDGLTRTTVRLSGQVPTGIRLTGVQPGTTARLTGTGINIRLTGEGRT